MRQPAHVSDWDGAAVLLARCAGKYPRLRHLSADQGYRGQGCLDWVREETGITIQIVQRKDGGFRSTWARADAPPRVVPMFAVVPRRWVIERSFAWLGRYRRLSKDSEYLAASQENAVYLATVMLLLHRVGRSLP
ncbi:transposase [Streptomyces sp. NPDC018045]|uniref:transposase n=1 Tax=Streptomyces sp. NPDC018045 TaxID=3365037 RepID=UPI0037ABA874